MPNDRPEEQGLGAYERPDEDRRARAEAQATREAIREAERRLPGGDRLPSPSD